MVALTYRDLEFRGHDGDPYKHWFYTFSCRSWSLHHMEKRVSLALSEHNMIPVNEDIGTCQNMTTQFSNILDIGVRMNKEDEKVRKRQSSLVYIQINTIFIQ